MNDERKNIKRPECILNVMRIEPRSWTAALMHASASYILTSHSHTLFDEHA